MSTTAQRIEVFQDTMDWIKNDPDLSASIPVAKKIGVTPTAFKELFNAYYNSLLVLKENGYHSISFPLISSSIFGGNLENPVAESARQCVRAYNKFVKDYPDYEIDVRLCAFTGSEMEKAKKEFDAQMGVEI